MGLRHARTQLLYGERLRRSSDGSRARAQLTASLVRFQALGAEPWSGRASAGLRAVGIPTTPDAPDPRAVLTGPELKIASMAASGLTNKEIGSRTFMSHRTVASMVYRILPKLGITTRAALRDALVSVAVPQDDGQEGPATGPVGPAVAEEVHDPGRSSQMTDAEG